MRRCRWVLPLVAVVGCVRHEPPSWDGATQSQAPVGAGSAVPASPDAARPDAMTAVDASPVDAASAPPADAAPVDAAPAVDPATLPQTRDKPEAAGPVFDARVAALWEAIVKDEPE